MFAKIFALIESMAKNKLKLGKFVKKRVADKEGVYVWTLKQTGKLSGARSKELKQVLDQAVISWMEPEE